MFPAKASILRCWNTFPPSLHSKLQNCKLLATLKRNILQTGFKTLLCSLMLSILSLQTKQQQKHSSIHENLNKAFFSPRRKKNLFFALQFTALFFFFSQRNKQLQISLGNLLTRRKCFLSSNALPHCYE